MNMAKNDLRIKIINNDKNRGLLYSRAMGILNSKGEYLMNLDPDDEFKGSDNLEYLYKMAKKSKIDFISFGFINILFIINYNRYLEKINQILLNIFYVLIIKIFIINQKLLIIIISILII